MRSRIFSLLLLAAGCFFIAGCDQPSPTSNHLEARVMRFWNGWLVTWVKDRASFSSSKGFYLFTKPAPGQP